MIRIFTDGTKYYLHTRLGKKSGYVSCFCVLRKNIGVDDMSEFSIFTLDKKDNKKIIKYGIKNRKQLDKNEPYEIFLPYDFEKEYNKFELLDYK